MSDKKREMTRFTSSDVREFAKTLDDTTIVDTVVEQATMEERRIVVWWLRDMAVDRCGTFASADTILLDVASLIEKGAHRR